MQAFCLKHRRLVICLVSIFLIFRSSVAAATPLTLKEQVSLITMMESGASAINALNYLGYIPQGQSLSFGGQFSESGFSSNISGQVGGNPFSLTYSGNLTGDVGTDLLLTLASNGALGAESISSSGQMRWIYDTALGQYASAGYREDGEINPAWLLVIEIIVLTIEVGVLIYEATHSHVESPGKADKVIEQKITIRGGAKSCSKTISDPLELSCAWDDNRIVTGSIQVPEPGTILLVLAGLFGVAIFSRRGRV